MPDHEPPVRRHRELSRRNVDSIFVSGRTLLEGAARNPRNEDPMRRKLRQMQRFTLPRERIEHPFRLNRDLLRRNEDSMRLNED